jgi:hypothetical protein
MASIKEALAVEQIPQHSKLSLHMLVHRARKLVRKVQAKDGIEETTNATHITQTARRKFGRTGFPRADTANGATIRSKKTSSIGDLRSLCRSITRKEV